MTRSPIAAVLLLSLVGCGAPTVAIGPYLRCEQAQQCADGGTCALPLPVATFGVCRASCSTSTECPYPPALTAGLVPVCLDDGLCALSCPDPDRSTCPAGQSCSPEGVCR